MRPDEVGRKPNALARKRVVDAFRELPPDAEFIAAAKMAIGKRGWSQRASDAIKGIFGNDADMIAKMLAATSPRVKLRENMIATLDVFEKYLQAGRPTDRAGIDKVLQQVPLVWKFDGRKLNAIRTLMGEPLEGQKVSSWARNTAGDMDAVTNDIWMALIGGMKKDSFNASEYSAMSAKIRRVADSMGWKPAEVQEAVWSFVKKLVESSGRTANLREAVSTMTPDDFTNVPEYYHYLLEDPDVKGKLIRLGIEPQTLENTKTQIAGKTAAQPPQGAGEASNPEVLRRTAWRIGQTLKTKRAFREEVERRL